MSHFQTQSNLSSWIDVETPLTVYHKRNSRNQLWELVFSDEFNQPHRNFAPGKDPIWTAMELPDGVNNALQYYSINMTRTVLDKGLGYLEIQVQRDLIDFRVYNLYKDPPGFEIQRMVSHASISCLSNIYVALSKWNATNVE